MMELRRLSPKQVLAKRLAPDIEALRPAPALKSSYLSNQHAALVPRCVCRQQCPHPSLACRNSRRQRRFCGLSDARDAAAGQRCVFNWQRHTRDKRIAEPRAVAATNTRDAGCGLRADRHA